jgi:chaperone modulatory protein CbpM
MIFEQTTVLTTSELGRLCTVEIQRIVELVEEGILIVDSEAGGEWRFAPSSLRRARTAIRLQKDLGINISGVALVIELLDEIAALRRQISLPR